MYGIEIYKSISKKTSCAGTSINLYFYFPVSINYKAINKKR